jgi:hypothetical protein
MDYFCLKKQRILAGRKQLDSEISNREFRKGGVGDEEFVFTLFWPRRKGRSKG